MNSYDCGVYVLMNIEHYLKNPMEAYARCAAKRRDRTLEDWFTPSQVTEKRRSLRALVDDLTTSYKLSAGSREKQLKEKEQSAASNSNNASVKLAADSDCEEIEIIE